MPAEKVEQIKQAYNFAAAAHAGQFRKSGEPYIEHPLQVAITLARLQFDVSSLVAALLHDIPEDCDISIQQIRARFGDEVAKLVDGVTNMERISWRGGGAAAEKGGRQAENLRKMLVAMAEDLRVVFIKLADRLHNMQTLGALPPDRRQAIARETLDIYAPLAHRLGIWEVKWQLEDLAFKYLEPRWYTYLAREVATRREERERVVEEAIRVLQGELNRAGLAAEISGRAKHLYSIYRKMERYAAKGRGPDEIYDLLALRVIVDNVSECYTALGIVHSLWRPIPGAFDDYIASPKPNGYQSLHTVVMYRGTIPLEVQVRTREMDRVAEYGVAAHWRYKEGAHGFHAEDKLSWLHQLIDWQRELSGAEEFLESVKTDMFNDQVFVFTPKGEIKDLPRGATPIDFAYRVHTELGHRTVGAKVNGRLVPLSYELRNGDVVEIVVAKKEDKGPSRDWLNADLGYVHTSHAREKIRQWFKRQERADNIEHGREMLEKELRRLGLKDVDRDSLARQFGYSLEDFLAAIGYGGLSLRTVTQKLADQEKPRPLAPTGRPTSPGPAVKVQGGDNMLTSLAKCCHPVPGDKIVGYVTRSRGITIHREDCYNILHEDELERLMPVEWGEAGQLYLAKVHIEAWDRVGLVRDISMLVAEEKSNIVNMAVEEHDNGITTMDLTLEVGGLLQLGHLLTKIETVNGIISAARVGADS